MLPNVDQSAYSKPVETKERADALVKDVPIFNTKNDFPAFDSKNLVQHQAHNVVPAIEISKKNLELVDEAEYQPEDASVSGEIMVKSPELIFADTEDETTFQTRADNDIDVSKTYPDVKHASTPSPVAAITITKDTTATVISSTLNSSQSLGVSVFQSSVATEQALQDTTDSTFFSQSQQVLTRSRGHTITRTINPEDLLQPPTPLIVRRQKRVLKAPKKDAAVEINPRRSARLAVKPKPASATTATKERQALRSTAKNVLLLSPVLNPGSERGRKDDSEEEDEDDYDKEGYDSGRRKKVVSKAAVERQRETRANATKRDSNARDGRTALECRGL